MRLTLAILLLPLVALGQSFTVTVSSNGVIRFPTNFFSANSNALVAVTGTGTGSGSTGTVTSVGLTMPAGFSVANSPVTGAGTLAVTGTLAPSAGGTGITNITAAGQALLAAADAAAQRDAMGLGTAATNNVPASGNAASGEVVLGSDTRLTDSRTPTSHSHDAGAITSGVFALARLATGTPHGSNFLRGDGAFAQVTTNDVPGLVAALAAGGGGTTNLVSSSAAGLAPQATADSYLGSTAAGAVQWFTRQIATNVFWGTPGTNTWTIPTNFLCGYVVAIGGGGGGQAGARRASAVATAGGVAGLPGAVNERWVTAADLGTNTTITVVTGSGGAGGASASADDTAAGATGTAGGNSTFGSLLTAEGGTGGTGLASGAFQFGAPSTRSMGNVPGAVTTSSQNNNSSVGYVGAGQTGSGITAANAASAFSTGGSGYATGTPGIDVSGTLAGGANGGSAGAAGGDGTSTALSGPYPGGGGGGGRSHASAAAGNGGNGGNYGASGGGGGASRNGFASGAGGNGGSGCVWIMYITR